LTIRPNILLKKNGYFVLPSLDNKKCDKIIESLEKLSFKAKKEPHEIRGLDYYLSISNIYEIINQKDIINIPEILELSKNPRILKIVSDYLGGDIIQTQSNCWFSTNYSYDDIKICGQEFHQDGTYEKFIKLFLYLNDVTLENGPHVYAVGSLNNLITPKEYHISQRVSDNFINQNYSKVKYFTGKKGSMNLIAMVKPYNYNLIYF